jgi:glycolate oxidase
MIDMRLLNNVVEVDAEGMAITAEGGATWKDVRDFARYKGFFLPVYPTFYASATVGGEISNGAVGIGALKYGPLRTWVRALEVVTPEGDILKVGNKALDLGNRNYNSIGLYHGAEGTLGIITKATLGLLPPPEAFKPLAYAFKDAADATTALQTLMVSGVDPYHVEFVDSTYLAMERALAYDLPGAGFLVWVALEGAKDEVAADTKVVDDLMASRAGAKQSDGAAQEPWGERRMLFRGRRLSGGLVVSHALLPLPRLPEAMARGRKRARSLKMDVGIRGYMADGGSVELNPCWPTDDRSFKSQASLAYIKEFQDISIDLGGHPMGLGFLLTFSLDRMHDAEAETVRQVKEALDPRNLMNRGKLVATMGRTPPLAPEEFFGAMPPRLMLLGLRALGGVKRIMPRDRYVPKAKEGR